MAALIFSIKNYSKKEYEPTVRSLIYKESSLIFYMDLKLFSSKKLMYRIRN